ncbi:MAG: crossover junction endodeoxyribonuclease RuvC [Candidatus Doudnabacteria bacterium]|nr:crossover junction endodeoxyribonuclease RuvC [Candidatus Doudnabacteria bacterium]
MIILGIDPGTATTGFGIIKQDKTKNGFGILDFGVIATEKTLSDAERLNILGNDLEEILKKFKPDAVGIEKLFFTTNQKTVMTVSQARGVVLYLTQKYKLPIFEFTPLQVKSFICGYGKADKKQVQYVVQKTFQLKKIPKPDDAADALAIALCAAHYFPKAAKLR